MEWAGSERCGVRGTAVMLHGTDAERDGARVRVAKQLAVKELRGNKVCGQMSLRGQAELASRKVGGWCGVASRLSRIVMTTPGTVAHGAAVLALFHNLLLGLCLRLHATHMDACGSSRLKVTAHGPNLTAMRAFINLRRRQSLSVDNRATCVSKSAMFESACGSQGDE